MKRAEIITALLEQARDKDTLANYDPNSIFTFDANVLTEAALMLFAVNDWVSVQDALPPKDTDVLVWLGTLKTIAIARYDGNGECPEADECDITRHVTHWMVVALCRYEFSPDKYYITHERYDPRSNFWRDGSARYWVQLPEIPEVEP